MDENKVIEVLKATLDPNLRLQAEKQLDQMHKIIGFAPILLRLIVRADIDLPIRQATVIYLKNLILNYWEKAAPKDKDNALLWAPDTSFEIHEQDRAQIRDTLIESVVNTPLVIQSQLVASLHHIIEHDFPNRWPQVVDKIHLYLSSTGNTSVLHGALLSLNRLVRNYEYKKSTEIKPMVEAMTLLLPVTHQLMCNLLTVDNDESYLLQKLILKTFFSLIDYNLPLDLLNQTTFTQWMEILLVIIARPVPEIASKITDAITTDDLNEMLSWKCKKWASGILKRIFERYGRPGDVEKAYKQFARWYLKTFSLGVIEVYLKVLNSYRNREFVGSRLVQKILAYLSDTVAHAFTWKLIRPHMSTIIQDVLFPILCYSSEDHELWLADPIEYIHLKFEYFQDFVSPVSAAEMLLSTVCKKRKNMLEGTMLFIVQVLNETPKDSSRQDGALHVIGVLSSILMKKDVYKNQLDALFDRYVIPEFMSVAPHVRARVCWICSRFHELPSKNDDTLPSRILQGIVNLFLHDKELPVRIEASTAILMYLNQQDDKCLEVVRSCVNPLTRETLHLIRETECEDVMLMLQKLFTIYIKELAPIATEICDHLSTTYLNLLSDDLFNEDKTLMVMNLLNTLELLLTSLDDHQESLLFVLESRILHIIRHTLEKKLSEFYEEVLTLLYYLTTKQITDNGFSIFQQLYNLVMEPDGDGVDYFVEMMPVFHNYIRVDADKFLSNENHLIAMYAICRQVLMSKDAGEDPQCHAAKLLEVIVLQFNGRIDSFLPNIVQLVFERLSSSEVKTSELRTLCLQVIIGVLYCNPQLLMNIIVEKLPPNAFNDFVTLWIKDSDCFLGMHDRKLCVLGLLTLIEMQPNRPPILMQFRNKFLHVFIMLFDGLKTAYSQKAKEDQDSDASSDLSLSDSDTDSRVLESSEDETLDTEKIEMHLNNNNNAEAIDEDGSSDEDDSSFDDSDLEDSIYESFTTPLDDPDNNIDEYVVFKDVFNTTLQTMEKKERGNLLIRNLSDTVKKEQFVLESDYLTNQLVVVPKHLFKEWNATYHEICDFIVPLSSSMITSDNEYGLFTVTMFKKVVEEFKIRARERKYLIRDFDCEQTNNFGEDVDKLRDDRKQALGRLLIWLRARFSECIVAWIHLKAIWVHVESVMRYGLMEDFVMVLVRPYKRCEKRLAEVLCRLYGNLDCTFRKSKQKSNMLTFDRSCVDGVGVGVGVGFNFALTAEYYPFVCCKINADLSDLKTLRV